MVLGLFLLTLNFQTVFGSEKSNPLELVFGPKVENLVPTQIVFVVSCCYFFTTLRVKILRLGIGYILWITLGFELIKSLI